MAYKLGVISDPEMLEIDLSPEDKFVVLATNGVWEVLTNKEVADIISPYVATRQAEKAAEALISRSY